MVITIADKIRILLKAWGIINLLPNYRMWLKHLFNPIDAVRYLEFGYLYKFLNIYSLSNLTILDIASPYVMAYILADDHQVLVTNIDVREIQNFPRTEKLKFESQNAISLPYSNNQFDLVYSISVIEHIYSNYLQAIREMVRVTKNNGYIYLTFPVSKQYIEEWRADDVYGHQYKENDQAFFQYRFDANHIVDLLSQIQNIKIIHQDIFWEKIDGLYNVMIKFLGLHIRIKPLNLLKNSLINYLCGFSLLNKWPDANFNKAKNFGNMHLIMKKII